MGGAYTHFPGTAIDLPLPPARSPTTRVHRLTSGSGLGMTLELGARQEKSGQWKGWLRTARLTTAGDDTHVKYR